MNAPSTHRLAVDLGTTWTAAAVVDNSSPRMVELGGRGASMPSVVAVGDAGELVVGQAAERIIAMHPDRGAREIKRRFGDTTPIVLAGVPYAPDALTAALLGGALAAAGVAAAETTVVLTHPANWGEYKLDLLRDVANRGGFAATELVSEPAAAARHYASTGRLSVGDAVAVYDFGGGTFDAAVIRVEADGATLLGSPQGLERLGGIDIDQVVFSHVAATLGGALEALDRSDPDVRRAIQQVRLECTTAKEQLSADSEATISVVAPGLNTQVRITRDELEAALRPRITETVRALERAVASAGLVLGDLVGVVLVGGSSRLPLVAEMVGGETGLTVLFDADAKSVVVMGAALGHGAVAAAGGGAAAAAAPAAGAAVATAAATVPPVIAGGAVAVSSNPIVPASPAPSKESAMSEPTTPDAAARPERGSVPPPPPPPNKKDAGKSNTGVIAGVAAVAVVAAIRRPLARHRLSSSSRRRSPLAPRPRRWQCRCRRLHLSATPVSTRPARSCCSESRPSISVRVPTRPRPLRCARN